MEKTDCRNRLNELNLTDLVCIKVTGRKFKEFNEEFCDVAIILWNDAKRRRPQPDKEQGLQGKKQGRRKRKNGVTLEMNI